MNICNCNFLTCRNCLWINQIEDYRFLFVSSDIWEGNRAVMCVCSSVKAIFDWLIDHVGFF